MVVDGTTYERGIGTHTPSSITYAVESGFSRFRSRVGLNRGEGGAVIFEVWCDGVRKLETPVIHNGEAREIEVDIQGVRVLRLVATKGGDNNNSNHADWAGARLTVAAQTRNAVKTLVPGNGNLK